jgi:hypothetical protein
MLYIKSLRALVVASLTGRIVVIDVDGISYPVISAYSEHKHAVRALEFLTSFKYIVSAERDIRLWGTCSLAQKTALLAFSNVASKALAAEDMRWRWGLRTVIIGSSSLGL